MPRDPLDTLARVRRMSHEEALAALALVLQAEEEADGLAKQAERTIAAETLAAGALDGDDGVVEAFAAWLPGARQRAAQARGACERAQADVSRARRAGHDPRRGGSGRHLAGRAGVAPGRRGCAPGAARAGRCRPRTHRPRTACNRAACDMTVPATGRVSHA